MKKRILVIVVILVVAALGIRGWQKARDRAAGVLAASGNIEITEVQVSFKVAGRLQERRVSEGQRVQKGDVIAVLDTRELAQQVNKAEAALAVARAEADRMKLEFARQKDLFDKQVISAREYELAQAQKGVTEARIQEAAAALALIATFLEDAVLKAPISGTVLAEHAESGEYVVPGTPVVSIGDLHDVWLRAYVAEQDLGRIKLGQEVRVRTDSYPGKSYPGKVSFISSEAEFTPRQVQTRKERVKLVYRIKVTIPNTEAELKPGMPADADISLR